VSAHEGTYMHAVSLLIKEQVLHTASDSFCDCVQNCNKLVSFWFLFNQKANMSAES